MLLLLRTSSASEWFSRASYSAALFGPNLRRECGDGGAAPEDRGRSLGGCFPLKGRKGVKTPGSWRSKQPTQVPSSKPCSLETEYEAASLRGLQVRGQGHEEQRTQMNGKDLQAWVEFCLCWLLTSHIPELQFPCLENGVSSLLLVKYTWQSAWHIAGTL